MIQATVQTRKGNESVEDLDDAERQNPSKRTYRTGKGGKSYRKPGAGYVAAMRAAWATAAAAGAAPRRPHCGRRHKYTMGTAEARDSTSATAKAPHLEQGRWRGGERTGGGSQQ
jgi:hypothetical protein